MVSSSAEKVDDVHARISEVFHNQLGLDAKQYNVSHLVVSLSLALDRSAIGLSESPAL